MLKFPNMRELQAWSALRDKRLDMNFSPEGDRLKDPSFSPQGIIMMIMIAMKIEREEMTKGQHRADVLLHVKSLDEK
jgi:hypothetical protein